MTAPGAIASTDVVIVGGGIVGAACAYELASSGVSVVLCEKSDLADGASGRNPGFVWMHTRRPGAQLQLSRRTRARYDTLPEEIEHDFDLRRNGGLIVFHTPVQHKVMAEFVDQRQREGVDVVLLDGDEARELCPILPADVLGASFCREDAQITTRKLVEGLARAAERHGAHDPSRHGGRRDRDGGERVTGVTTLRGGSMRTRSSSRPASGVPCSRRRSAWTSRSGRCGSRSSRRLSRLRCCRICSTDLRRSRNTTSSMAFRATGTRTSSMRVRSRTSCRSLSSPARRPTGASSSAARWTCPSGSWAARPRRRRVHLPPAPRRRCRPCAVDALRSSMGGACSPHADSLPVIDRGARARGTRSSRPATCSATRRRLATAELVAARVRHEPPPFTVDDVALGRPGLEGDGSRW